MFPDRYSEQKISRRGMIGSAAALASGAFLNDLQAKTWNVFRISGRDYVTDKNVADFYSFPTYQERGTERFFQSDGIKMQWKTGSQSVYINNIKFSLSFPVSNSKGRAMISTVDLAKLIDPVLRPSFIKRPALFDTVIIDPGHGAHDSGAVGPFGPEKTFALDTSLKLERILKQKGFKTLLTRRTDVFLSLSERVRIANKQKNAVFVSIHYNFSGSSSASGVETFALAPQGTRSTHGGSASSYSSTGNARDAENIALATAIHAPIISSLKPVDRGLKRARFNVLRGINKPAVLFEGGFLSHRGEAKNVSEDAYRQKQAEAIAEGIIRFRAVLPR